MINSFKIFNLPINDFGGFFGKFINLFAISDNSLRLSIPSAQAILDSLPNKLIKTGICFSSTFSKSKAGPLFFIVRSAISVISSSELTGVEIRTNSFFSSRKFMKSAKSLNISYSKLILYSNLCR